MDRSNPILTECGDEFDRAVAAMSHDSFELYERVAVTRRVELDIAADRCHQVDGVERGSAIRAGAAAPFVASSGGIDQLLRRASSEMLERSSAAAWNLDADNVVDLDRSAEMASGQEMESWLRRNASTELVELRSVWAETALTLECWSDGRHTQKRVRGRSWAAWSPREVGRMSARPLVAAARNWRRLSDFDPDQAWRERERHRGRAIPWPGGAAIVLSPDVSASLAYRLALVLHAPSAQSGAEVGPGWRLFDRPLDRTALFGSSRDDSGFPTSQVELADGERTLNSWSRRGCERRGSYRDLPQPSPTCLELIPPQVEVPSSAVWVTDLTVHPGAAGEWLLELHARPYPEGVGIEPHWIRIRPAAIARSCLGAVGESRQGMQGVRTPALLFRPDFG